MIETFFSFSGKANIGGHKGTTNTSYSIRKIFESNLFSKSQIVYKDIKVLNTTSITDEGSNISLW